MGFNKRMHLIPRNEFSCFSQHEPAGAAQLILLKDVEKFACDAAISFLSDSVPFLTYFFSKIWIAGRRGCKSMWTEKDVHLFCNRLWMAWGSVLRDRWEDYITKAILRKSSGYSSLYLMTLSLISITDLDCSSRFKLTDWCTRLEIHEKQPYSSLSAMIGSTFIALRTGAKFATSDTSSSSNEIKM